MQKPAHKKGPSAREVIWKAIRLQREFTVASVRRELPGEISVYTIRDYCAALVAGEYLHKQGPRYTLLIDPGADAPKLRQDGTNASRGAGREALWLAMRIMKRFTVLELAATASQPERQIATGEARNYCYWLCRAGYIAREQGHGGNLARYRLIPNRARGPKPPQIQRRGAVWDPNTNQVVYQRECPS